jgi:hypothetical protein
MLPKMYLAHKDISIHYFIRLVGSEANVATLLQASSYFSLPILNTIAAYYLFQYVSPQETLYFNNITNSRTIKLNYSRV